MRAEHSLEHSRSKRIRRTNYGHSMVCRTKHDTLARAIEIITVQAASSLNTSSTVYRDMERSSHRGNIIHFAYYGLLLLLDFSR